MDDDSIAAFDAFYRAVTPQLTGFLVLQGAQLADAVDITQDTLTAAYKQWDIIEKPRPWSFRVASRALVRKVTQAHEAPVAEIPVPSPLLRSTADIDNWEQQHDIVGALKHLPPRQRQVMAWTIYGYTPSEIADELQIDSATVRANLMKARRTLSVRLAGTEGTP